MSDFEALLSLSFATYNSNFYGDISEERRIELLSIINEYTPVIITGITDNNGFYERENFACAA